MVDMKYSEENYKENINNKNLMFFSVRMDGFGARMTALLNAMYCSKKFNIPFAFTWTKVNNFKTSKFGENKVLGTFVGEPEEIFSHDFLKKHRLTDEMASKLGLRNGVDFSDFWKYSQIKNFCFDDLLHYKCLDPAGWSMPCGTLSQMFSSINEKEYKKICKECWKEIGFSDDFLDIIKKVDSAVQNKGKFITIHVRSGDIVYNVSTQSGKRWIMIMELAAEIIIRELPHYDIILLGEDIMSLQRVIEFVQQWVKEKNIDCHGHSVIMSKDLIENNTYEDEKLAFYDCYVLSKGEKIYTSSNSTFSRLASLISDTNERYSCYDYFSAQEQFNYVLSYVDKLNLHPAQQAYSYLHLVELSKELGKTFEEQLLYAMEMLSSVRALPKEMSSSSMRWKVTYLLFLIKTNCNDLFDKFVNKLALPELKQIVIQNCYLHVADPLNAIYYQKMLYKILTSDLVCKGHYLSDIKNSMKGVEKEHFNGIYEKISFKSRVLLYIYILHNDTFWKRIFYITNEKRRNKNYYHKVICILGIKIKIKIKK